MAKHIGIVGAGIIGACIARELALRGCKVTVFEAHEPASGASSRSMGWINASFVDREDYYLMRLAAIEAHRELDEAFGGTLQMQWTGSLNWDADPDRLEELAGELGRFGHPVRVTTAAEMAKLEPHLADLPEKALLMDNEGVTEAGHMTRVLLRAAQDEGAVVLAGAEVTGIEKMEAGGHVIVSPAGHTKVDEVVIAAGVKTGKLAEILGFSLPMKNEPGVLIETNDLPFRLNHTIWSPDVHFKQLPDGTTICGNLYSGAIGDGGAEGEAERMLARMRQRLPDAPDLRIEKVRHGVRPMPLDTYPAIGRLGGDDVNPYVAVMHSGVTLAPLVGRLVAAEMAENSTEPMLQPFRPSRFNV
jgi:glycine/D-amino acid oxidase-like deaminating enzyme